MTVSVLRVAVESVVVAWSVDLEVTVGLQVMSGWRAAAELRAAIGPQALSVGSVEAAD